MNQCRHRYVTVKRRLPANRLQFFWLHLTIDHSKINTCYVSLPYRRTTGQYLGAVSYTIHDISKLIKLSMSTV